MYLNERREARSTTVKENAQYNSRNFAPDLAPYLRMITSRIPRLPLCASDFHRPII
jgi:hypothetical protein